MHVSQAQSGWGRVVRQISQEVEDGALRNVHELQDHSAASELGANIGVDTDVDVEVVG